MRKLLIAAMLLVTCANFAQTTISFGGGVLEQSRVLGTGFAIQGEVIQEVHRNFGLTASYTHGLLQTGNATLVIPDGDTFYTLDQAPPGARFHQVELLANWKFYTNDEVTGFRINGGGVWQNNGGWYPAAGFDIIAFPTSPIHAYFSWLPVFRGAFDEGDGWSHTVTLNFAIRL